MENFEKIKRAYRECHESFLKTHPVLLKYLPDGVWVPSLPKELFKVFKKVGDKNKAFLDLGSGDGIAVMVASLFFRKADGVEKEKEFFDIAVKMKEKLQADVDFFNKDFHDAHFKEYGMLFIAPDKEFTLKLENKLRSELNGKLIVFSSIFQPKTLKKISEFETDHRTVYIYENSPKNV